MRLDKPPTFMISPASMKKGTAISGKLSAPLITFCATIWASNRSMLYISATPHSSSAKAIGMPSAMDPSREPRKIEITMSGAPYFLAAVAVRA